MQDEHSNFNYAHENDQKEKKGKVRTLKIATHFNTM